MSAALASSMGYQPSPTIRLPETDGKVLVPAPTGRDVPVENMPAVSIDVLRKYTAEHRNTNDPTELRDRIIVEIEMRNSGLHLVRTSVKVDQCMRCLFLAVDGFDYAAHGYSIKHNIWHDPHNPDQVRIVESSGPAIAKQIETAKGAQSCCVVT